MNGFVPAFMELCAAPVDGQCTGQGGVVGDCILRRQGDPRHSHSATAASLPVLLACGVEC